MPASRYHTSDSCPMSLSSIRSPWVEQLICTTSPERRERTVLAAVLGRSRTATAQSPPPQRTVKAIGSLRGGAAAMVVVTSAGGAVDVVTSLLAAGATRGLDFAPLSRPMAATTPTAAVPSRTTTAAKMRTRLGDRRAGGVSTKVSVGAGTTLEAARVRAPASVWNVDELSTPNAAFSNAAIRSPASARVSAVVESPARVAELDLMSDRKSQSDSRSLSSESCPESDPLAIGRKWYSLDVDAAGSWSSRVIDGTCAVVDQIETNRERKLLASCWSPRTVPALIRPYAVSTRVPGSNSRVAWHPSRSPGANRRP